MAFTEFDTVHLPQEQRFEWWRDAVWQGVEPTWITSDFAADFVASVGSLDLGRLQLTQITFPALRSERTAELIRRSDPEVYELTLILEGVMGFSQERHTTRLHAGDITLWTSSRPYRGEAAGGPTSGVSRALILHVPRALVPLPEARIARVLAHGLPTHDGMGRVLADFLGSLLAEAPALDERSRVRLGDTVLGLATGFLAHRLDAEECLAPETRHELLLARIDVFVRDNLADPALAPGVIAARHHISVRLLHQLFRLRQETVAASIRRQRLENCAADLAEPRLRTLPVHDIAARWGLENAASFSRTFRSFHGTTPGEYRRRALDAKDRCARGQ
ncbi:helix-turn-helix domain-containing protein [Streptomyces sp. NBC_00234]|uniref:AraC-like ligand-binding domain-containing protein n=1 Tax=Streptomyces sp. NBC_00234 TaxID=2903638 RepID=UPI002E2DC187|nr:helix-turn-helix domain-containing protein [Streptomyces sp. NBC_00234]